MPKMLSDGDDLLLWIPDGGIANVSAPTVAELTAAGVLDISCLVTVANFQLGANGDNQINDPALCSAGDSTVPGRTTYQAAMDFYRWTTPSEDTAWTTFTDKGIAGFLAHRIGSKHTVGVAAADDFAVYAVITGTPQKIVPDANGGFRKFHQEFYVQGENVDERAVVAAGA